MNISVHGAGDARWQWHWTSKRSSRILNRAMRGVVEKSGSGTGHRNDPTHAQWTAARGVENKPAQGLACLRERMRRHRVSSAHTRLSMRGVKGSGGARIERRAVVQSGGGPRRPKRAHGAENKPVHVPGSMSGAALHRAAVDMDVGNEPRTTCGGGGARVEHTAKGARARWWCKTAVAPGVGYEPAHAVLSVPGPSGGPRCQRRAPLSVRKGSEWRRNEVRKATMVRCRQLGPTVALRTSQGAAGP
ncbi:hypothetical protein GGX14DRAFT_397754 [Mycena pura]|uniref:Uncharacterized protein n=1 Tax=Mycena pura TaxID=153505 RepID=A0AAD6V859_9AGAR|nr:hypothetical protein GGX14DRAFT_397754 [Mycena pura]